MVFKKDFFKNGSMVGLVILAMGYMLSSRMNLNRESLLSVVFMGAALMCVFTNKRKTVNNEACFLVSIYLLSTFLAKQIGLREGFSGNTDITVTPNAEYKVTQTEVDAAFGSTNLTGYTSGTPPTQPQVGGGSGARGIWGWDEALWVGY